MLSVTDNMKYSRVVLGGGDYYSLSQLYMPLMGIDSMSLYIFLANNASLPINEISVRIILDYMKFDNIGLLEYSLNKLEALGLVKKYHSKTKGYFYNLFLPLSAEDFLTNTFLANFYIEEVGEVEYTNQKSRLVGMNLKGYTEETKAFDEVYKNGRKYTGNIVSQTLSEKIPQKLKNNIKVRNDKFDYLIFKMFVSEEILSPEVLNEKEFEEFILKISYQYNLNEEEMKNVLVKSISVNKDLNFEDITIRAGYLFQGKKNPETLTFPEKEVELFKNDLTTDENELLNLVQTKSITEMLALVSGGKGSLADVRDFSKLLDITSLPVEVINVLIFHLAGFKGDENVSYTYIEKVARNWMKAGVRTAKDAIIITREKEESKKKGRAKTVSEVPEWLKEDNDTKEINSKNVDENLDKKPDNTQDLSKKVFG